MMRPRRADDVLFDHDAAEVVGAAVEPVAADVDSLRQPGDLNVRNVVEIEPADREPAQILVGREAVGNLAADRRVVRLQRPRDEGDEAARVLLHLIEPIQVLDAVLERLAQSEHHRRCGRDAEPVGGLHDFEPLVAVALGLFGACEARRRGSRRRRRESSPARRPATPQHLGCSSETAA